MDELGAKNFEPGPELLLAVRSGFVRKGSTFSAYCKTHEINRRNATIALLGGWRGPKGKALACRIARAAGLGSIHWDTPQPNKKGDARNGRMVQR